MISSLPKSIAVDADARGITVHEWKKDEMLISFQDGKIVSQMVEELIRLGFTNVGNLAGGQKTCPRGIDPKVNRIR